MMKNSEQAKYSSRRWRWLMLLFFFILLVPTGILIYKAYDELKWEALHQQRQLAEALADRIDKELSRVIVEESRRGFNEYQFLLRRGDQAPLQLSPLASVPPVSRIPGLIGYFQVDGKGRLTTPLLPENDAIAKRWGIDPNQLKLRKDLRRKMLKLLAAASVMPSSEVAPTPKLAAEIMNEKELVAPATVLGAVNTQSLSESAEEQRLSRRAFDNLVSRVEQKKRAKIAKKAPSPQYKSKLSVIKPTAKRKKDMLADKVSPAPESDDESLSIKVFDKEREPFQLYRLGNDHLLLYRQLWKNGTRYIQGLILNQTQFIEQSIGVLFQSSALAKTGALSVIWQNEILSSFQNVDAGKDYSLNQGKLRDEVLYQYRLSAPLDEWQLRFLVGRLSAPPGSQAIHWIAGSLLLVLIGGFYLMYRLGLRQIALVSQQQDFVSAVSHELKTPLTSISMYSEMLREGWVDEARKNSYYDFIYFESQRLSRLIGNVLQMAKLSRNRLQTQPTNISAGELMDSVCSAVAAQIARAEFKLDVSCKEPARSQMLRVDVDHFMQIMINLVDNALKFSAKSSRRQLDISCELQGSEQLSFKVRDYGPGIDAGQMKRIFERFYRAENEMTRETTGTGIGLALVKELLDSMGAKIHVRNLSPGVEFEAVFPLRN